MRADARAECRFCWYSDNLDEDGKAIYPDPETNFNYHVRLGVNRIKKLTDKPIFLAVEAMDLMVKSEKTLMSIFDLYWEYARIEPRIVGLDLFVWLDVPEEKFRGMRSHPLLQKYIFGAIAGAPLRVPKGPFKIWTVTESWSGYGGFYSNGSSFCGFSTYEQWMKQTKIPITDERIPRVGRLPDMVNQGVCK